MRFAATVLLSVLFLSGCAVRKPTTYRLVPQDRARILVPPGVVTQTVVQSVLTIPVLRWLPACAPTGSAVLIQPGKKKVRITVHRDALITQPAGWLSEWTAQTEGGGCLAPGAGMDLALRILESLPLDPSSAYALMHSDSIRKGYVDLGPESRLQVITPVMSDGTVAEAPVESTGAPTGSGNQLNVDVRMSSALLGVETAWYALQPKPDRIGSTIVPVSTERNFRGRKEAAAAPIINHFQMSPRSAFYRLLYKTDPSNDGITEIIVTAPTRAELDRNTSRILADTRLCQKTDPDMCIVIPRRVAVNPFMVVTVNGAEVRLSSGATVRSAIQSGGGPAKPQDVLPQLTITKSYAGKPAPVVFDRTTPAILDLRLLLGGESLTWK